MSQRKTNLNVLGITKAARTQLKHVGKMQPIHSFPLVCVQKWLDNNLPGAKKVYGAILSPNRKLGFQNASTVNVDELRERIANEFVALRRTRMARTGHERRENRSNKMRGT